MGLSQLSTGDSCPHCGRPYRAGPQRWPDGSTARQVRRSHVQPIAIAIAEHAREGDGGGVLECWHELNSDAERAWVFHFLTTAQKQFVRAVTAAAGKVE